MVIGLLTLELHFPGARSLKDKRQALRSLMAKLKGRLNVAVAEVEHQNLWQRSRLAVVSVNTEGTELDKTLAAARSMAESEGEILVVEAQAEVL